MYIYIHPCPFPAGRTFPQVLSLSESLHGKRTRVLTFENAFKNAFNPFWKPCGAGQGAVFMASSSLERT